MAHSVLVAGATGMLGSKIVFTLNLKGASTFLFDNKIWGPVPKLLPITFGGQWHI